MLAITSILAITSSANAISQGFSSDEPLASGTLVSLLKSGDGTIVVPSELDRNNIAGVVVDKEDATVALSSISRQCLCAGLL